MIKTKTRDHDDNDDGNDAYAAHHVCHDGIGDDLGRTTTTRTKNSNNIYNIELQGYRPFLGQKWLPMIRAGSSTVHGTLLDMCCVIYATRHALLLSRAKVA